MPIDIAQGATKRKIFIVDDHPIVRQGLALLINREPDLIVCGDAEETSSALRRIEELKPELVIVDISLNGPDGLDLL
jgi:DNA-binding NarL/FixJ family response regulator